MFRHLTNVASPKFASDGNNMNTARRYTKCPCNVPAFEFAAPGQNAPQCVGPEVTIGLPVGPNHGLPRLCMIREESSTPHPQPAYARRGRLPDTVQFALPPDTLTRTRNKTGLKVTVQSARLASQQMPSLSLSAPSRFTPPPPRTRCHLPPPTPVLRAAPRAESHPHHHFQKREQTPPTLPGCLFP